MYFNVNGMDYWYESHGEGIPIVLLHGFTGSGHTWDELISSNSKDYRFITVDLPGHGNTKGSTCKSMEACIDDLHALFKHMELHRFLLVGYSMGGRTALSYAVKYPKNLLGLVLESASPGLADQAAREARKDQDELLAGRIEREGVESFVAYWENIPLFDTQKRLPEKVRMSIRSERLEQTTIGLANSLRGMGTGSQPSNWERLDRLSIPVQLIVGSLDKKFVQINERMKGLLPQGSLQVISDCGHAVHIEDPASFEHTLLEFAKTLTS